MISLKAINYIYNISIKIKNTSKDIKYYEIIIFLKLTSNYNKMKEFLLI